MLGGLLCFSRLCHAVDLSLCLLLSVGILQSLSAGDHSTRNLCTGLSSGTSAPVLGFGTHPSLQDAGTMFNFRDSPMESRTVGGY